MASWGWVVIAVLITAAVAAALWSYARRRRTQTLRRRFGSEYDRTVHERGRKGGELELGKREERVHALRIRDLSREERDGYANSWRAVQARFVDDPGAAISDADALVGDLMRDRGYPVGDFEQRAADLSVEHGRVVDNYRAAHDIALRHRRGEAHTEDLRKAMMHCRALFEELLGDRVRVAGRSSEVNYE